MRENVQMEVKIERHGSNWGNKKFKVEQITDFLKGLDWMKRHGYQVTRGYNVRGHRIVKFTSAKTSVFYLMEIYFNK